MDLLGNADRNKRPVFEQLTGRPDRCLVCKHGSHVTGIWKADWPGMKNKTTNSHALLGSGRRPKRALNVCVCFYSDTDENRVRSLFLSTVMGPHVSHSEQTCYSEILTLDI